MSPHIESLELRKLGSNFTFTFLRQGLAVAVGFGLSIFLARLLGPQGNGQYAMGIILPTMLATLLNLGVAPSNVYHIASGKIDPKNAFKATIFLWFSLSVIGVLIGAVIITINSNMWFPGVPSYLLWLGILVFPVMLLQILVNSFFQGLQEFKKFNVTAIVAPISTLLLAFLLVGIMNKGVLGAISSFIFGNFITLLVSIKLLKPHLSGKTEVTQSTFYLKDCLKYGYKAHLSNILTFVNYRADVFLVNFFLNPVVTGIYVVAVQIAESLWMLSSSVSTVLLPRLSELSKDENKRKYLTPLIARLVLLISAFVAILMAILIFPVINIFYGREYIDAAYVLLLLLPGIVIGSMTKIIANDIAARGKPQLNLYTSLLGSVTNIILNIALIPKWGIEGAAISTSLSYTLNAIIIFRIYSRLSKNSFRHIILFSNDDKQLAHKAIKIFKSILLNR